MAEERNYTEEEQFLADFAGTEGKDLARLGGAHEWNESKYIKECKTKADVVKLVIYTNRTIALVQTADTAEELRSELQAAAKSVSDADENDEDELEAAVNNAIAAIVDILSKIGVKVPAKTLNLVPVRSGSDPMMRHPERPISEAEEGKPKPKPAAVMTMGLKLNPFQYIKELRKIKVSSRKNEELGVTIPELGKSESWQI
jgi:hypothetical protein